MSRYWSAIVHRLAPYVPGDQPAIAHPIKLNTNENPYPPSPMVLAAIARELGNAGDNLRRYPDPVARRLRATVAAHHGLKPEQVFVGNGSDEVLAHTFASLLKHHRPLRFPDITYSFYPTYARLFDVCYRAMPVADDMSICVNDYVRDVGGVLLANPNAPTGRALSLADIERIVVGNKSSVVVIDEAYVDFGAQSALPLVDRYPNLLVVHTTSKARSLAGMRVGLSFGHADLIEALNRVKDSFNSYPLDRLAQAAAQAAYEDQDYYETTRARVIASRERMKQALERQGFDVVPSAANFVFARHSSHDAAVLAARLKDQGIFVRHFRQPRIEQYLRITVGTEEECRAVVAALHELLV
ncbi:histidinol-phosphate transaminase [Paraburkholderia phenoliruptrix]|uniref:Histidinol-phosphate aminotransferase n=2 Tax=Paraburkholderia phenoliruptrix TaxID=252970 RepID=K0DWI2_9BURK|nr:histidinol-phosphate transaminase [Paraburkholderia phenoliruptrix]AFT90521.1 Histidinol-phosphate aminotransferase [Paraburkholderia phenoliruptrix BR3459a]CAB4053041.1 Histidinol-phosphate aminotransferase [Paraburkholderia phenoliruptrix]